MLVRSLDSSAIILAGFALLFGVSLLPAQNNELTVVSAASYQKTITPDSWASGFGADISPVTVIAELDPDGQWPVEVAGITVKVNDRAARIYFVSREGQVNFLVPHETEPGTATVVLRSKVSGRTYTGTVQVLLAAPALFSLDASGQGPGAILNAVTYKGEPFRVETPENRGEDKRTRLAIYGTGFRYARNLTVAARAESGGAYELPVEYSGPAPGYFGLDQLNLVLPAEADGIGTVTLILRTPTYNSNAVTFEVDPLETSAIRLTSIRLDQSSVRGGLNVTGRVRLNGRAPAFGADIALQSDNLVAQPPTHVIVREGDVEAAFTVTTMSTLDRQTATLSAVYGEVTKTALLAVEPHNPVLLDRVTLAPDTVLGGKAATGTVRLREQLPAGTLRVALSASEATAEVPPSVTILAGQISADFPIRTKSVASPRPVRITASIEGSTTSAILTVRPAVTISVNPDSVAGGTTVVVSIELGEAAPAGGADVEVRSDSPSVNPPAVVRVPAGHRLTTFYQKTSEVLSDTPVTLTAFYAGSSHSVILTLKAPAAGILKSLLLNPTTVIGGNPVTGTVTLTAAAPPGGVTVSLQSNDLAATPPAFVTVLAGSTTAAFLVQTFPVIFDTDVTISATAGGVTKTASLKVTAK